MVGFKIYKNYLFRLIQQRKIVLFHLDGWSSVTTVTEEIKSPEK